MVVGYVSQTKGHHECVANDANARGHKLSSISKQKRLGDVGWCCYWLAAAGGRDALAEHRPRPSAVYCALKS